MTRLGLVLVLLTFSTACSHLVVENSGALALQQVSDTTQRPGSGITRYPVRMREIRAD